MSIVNLIGHFIVDDKSAFWHVKNNSHLHLTAFDTQGRKPSAGHRENTKYDQLPLVQFAEYIMAFSRLKERLRSGHRGFPGNTGYAILFIVIVVYLQYTTEFGTRSSEALLAFLRGDRVVSHAEAKCDIISLLYMSHAHLKNTPGLNVTSPSSLG